MDDPKQTEWQDPSPVVCVWEGGGRSVGFSPKPKFHYFFPLLSTPTRPKNEKLGLKRKWLWTTTQQPLKLLDQFQAPYKVEIL